MGRRGPPPKPTALRILAGNPSRRPLNANEPKPRQAIPRCPSWLDDEAKRQWNRTASQLRDMGVLTIVDADALANYCDSWSRWKRAVLFLQKNGDVFTCRDEFGKLRHIQQWPQVGIAKALLAVLNQYQQEFGLTPASRSRVSVNDGGPPMSGIAEILRLARTARWTGRPEQRPRPVAREEGQPAKHDSPHRKTSRVGHPSDSVLIARWRKRARSFRWQRIDFDRGGANGS